MMKKGLMIALVVFCAGLAVGCAGQSSDRNAETAESPVADTSGGQELPEETGGSDGGQDASGKPNASNEADTLGEEGTSDATEAIAGGGTDSKKDKESQTSSTDQKTGSAAGNKKDTQSSQSEKKSSEKSITLKQAKSIALKKAGLKEQDGSWKKAKVDWEDGRKVYDLEFISGNTEYDFEIDVENGDILEYDKDFD